MRISARGGAGKNRVEDAPARVRGIPRPFPETAYGDFHRAFDGVVGSKAAPSEGERRLIDKARTYCRILAKLPAIRRVWVCNSLSMNAADGDSDIDLFVETAPGRLWTGRAVATAFFAALGVRRHGNKVAGRFCLSFFAVENADFGTVAVENDAYLYEWARRLIPVGGLGDVPNTASDRDSAPPAPGAAYERNSDSPAPGFWARAVERAVRALMMPKTLREYARLGKPWGIEISETMLKFHPEDRRKEIRAAVAKRLGVPECQ